jgi:hypothetical protein
VPDDFIISVHPGICKGFAANIFVCGGFRPFVLFAYGENNFCGGVRLVRQSKNCYISRFTGIYSPENALCEPRTARSKLS